MRNHDRRGGGTGRGAGHVERRGFLRGFAAAATVGVTGLATVGTAGAADVTDDYPRVSTRDHFDDDADLTDGETAHSYDVEGDWSAIGDDTLTVWVHGWRTDAQEAVEGAEEAQSALEANGYGGDVVAYSWDADKGDSLDLGWADAKDIADGNGEKLANFLTDWSADHDTPVRVVAHSLGARVTVDTCRSLQDDFEEPDALTSATLLGGAIEDDDPSLDAGWFDDEYGPSIEYAVGEFDNFYSGDDPVLRYIFNTREFEDAVGEVGIEGPAPDNYEDHDVTDRVDGHSGYYQRADGVMDRVLAEW